MRRAKWKGAGWPKEKPKLTRAYGEAILKAAQNARDRLILRLVMEAGLKTGQIVGNQSHGANIPPLRIRDLADNFVVVRIHRLGRELPLRFVEPEETYAGEA